MKYYIYLFFLCSICADSFAQMPVIKQGTQIQGKFFFYGQSVQVKMTVAELRDSVMLNWNILGATGSYLLSPEGFKHGTKINFVQPSFLKVLRLAPDETFGVISKDAFSTLKKNNKMVYNSTTYVLVKEAAGSQTFKAGDQQLRVLHIKGVEEPCEMWILDDPTFPLVCQIKNNPLGINFTLLGIK